jgi:isopentenyl-diphosphate delta-isomerase
LTQPEKQSLSTLIPAWVDGILQPVEKLQAHIKGLKHPAISVFLIAGQHTLIQKRAATKYHTPGLWTNTVCTHPNWQEDSAACAQRRLDEELGITQVNLDFRRTVEYRATVGNDLTEHEVVDIFVGHVDQNIEHCLNPDEVSDIRWLTFAELAAEIQKTPGIFTPWLQIYMRDHLDAIL